jgi:hypothetical protein
MRRGYKAKQVYNRTFRTDKQVISRADLSEIVNDDTARLLRELTAEREVRPWQTDRNELTCQGDNESQAQQEATEGCSSSF